MKVLGIIPARFDSSRFPGKPLIDLNGKSMIQRVYEGAKKSSFINDLIVATDDQRILDHVIKFGGKAMLTSKNHQSGTDRCAEVLKNMEGFDVVINIQGDEPLVDYRQLDLLIQSFFDPNIQIATLGHNFNEKEDILNPNRVKIVVNHKSQALYFSRSTIPYFGHGNVHSLSTYPYLRHIGLYAYRANVLNELTLLPMAELEKMESLEQLRWLYNGYAIQVILTDIETPNIDTPEDVQKVVNLL